MTYRSIKDNKGCTSCKNPKGCKGCNSCQTEECGCKVTVATNCVRYTGAELPCLNIIEGDSLETILSKINTYACEVEVNADDIIYCGGNITCGGETVISSNTTLTEIISSLSERICNIPPTDTSTYSGTTVECGGNTLATDGEKWASVLATLCGLITPVRTFNIVSMKGENGSNETFEVTGNAGTNLKQDQILWVDRIGDTSDIVVTITSTDGITFDSALTSKTISSTYSTAKVEFDHPTGLIAGSYDVVLTWVSDYVTKIQNITFILT